MKDPAFIIGAGGFIGGKVAERLLQDGRRVRVLSRRSVPHLEKLGAAVVSGDLDDLAALRRGCEGAGTVFHVAGRVGVWGPAADFFRVNVAATPHLILACHSARVSRPRYITLPPTLCHPRRPACLTSA